VGENLCNKETKMSTPNVLATELEVGPLPQCTTGTKVQGVQWTECVRYVTSVLYRTVLSKINIKLKLIRFNLRS
jgi:hypothetical protein